MKSKVEVRAMLMRELQGLSKGKLPGMFFNTLIESYLKIYEKGILEAMSLIEGTDAWYSLKRDYEEKWQ